MKHLKNTILTLLVGFVTVACAPCEENLIIISTSDTHAKIEMLPRLAAFVSSPFYFYTYMLKKGPMDLFKSNYI